MFTIFGATHTLTQEMMVLCAALGAFLIGIVLITVDVVRRSHRRREAQNRPIDTSMFQQPREAAPAADEAEAAEGATANEAEAAPAPGSEILAPESPHATPAHLVYATSGTIYGADGEPAEAHSEPGETEPAAEAPEQQTPDLALTEEAVAARNAEPTLAQTATTPEAGQHILLCDGFGAGFGAKVVLADVNFAVPDQGVTTLMGPAGAGKSTLLRALGGALAQSGLFKSWGQVWFRGAALSPENRPLLVAQRIQLVQRPVLENLTFHLRDRTENIPEEKQRRWASKWLTQAGAENLAGELDRPFKDLAPLAQRIVTILREAAAEPALLMLDEPATGLPEADAAVLLSMLERLASFVPLLLVLQNQKHARKISSQIVLVAGGQVQAACATADFFDTPPNEAVAQFIATGTCNVPGAETVAIRTVSAVPPPAPTAPTAPAKTVADLLAAEDEPVAADEMVAPEAHDLPPAAPAAEDEDLTLEPVPAEPEAVEDIAALDEAEQEAEQELELNPADEPAPMSPEELKAIKDEIRNILAAELSGAVPVIEEAEPAEAIAPEPELEPETIEPEPLPEPEVTEFEINAAAPEPVLENAESQHEELAREPEAAMAEPVAVEPEMIAEPEPVLESMDYAADAGPEAESQHEEPDHGPALTTPEPDIIEAIAEPAFEAASGLVSEPEPALEPLHEIVAAEPAGTEPGILEATAKPELSFETVAAEVLEPAAHEAEPIAVAANPEPVLDGEPAPLGEPIEEESVLYDEAEPVEAPVRFAPSTSAPLTIEMEHVSFAAPVQDENLDESPFLDELPTINLSANMIQSVPLPPRAAAAQMSAPAADPRRFEDAAVMRHPGQGGPGPRGFVWIETGRLAATPMPGLAAPIEQDLDMLKDAGVTMLITLTEQDFPQNLLVRHGLRNLHFPIADQKAPSTGDTDMLVTQMRDLLGQGEILAVHCLAGLGRTGTILAAYMVREQGLSAQAALNQIRHFNRQFVQTDDQEDFLMEYEVQQEQIQLRNRATGSGAKLLK